MQLELSGDERIQVVGKSNSLRNGKRLCRTTDFDVLLLDLNLADGSGYQLLELIHAQKPTCQSIVCTVTDLDEHVSRAFDLGASGYLLKHSWFGNYAQSILQVANGGAAISPHLAKRLLHRFDQGHGANNSMKSVAASSQEQLSSREKDILRMVASGFTSTEIAGRLSISHMTVNTHIRNTYRKLQVRSRAQAVQSAMVRGLI
ncbi:MAG: response regulator transcription factor [Comamonas sp.]